MGTITPLTAASLDLTDLDVALIAGTTLSDTRPDYLRLHVDDVIPTRWWAYARKSDVRNAADEVGLDRQHRSCEAKVAPHAPNGVERWFVDSGRSSSKFSKKPRPAFDELVALIVSGQARGVGIVFWDQDRFVRRPAEFETVLTACEAGGVDYLWSTQGDVDLRNSSQVTYARMKVAWAAEESAKTSRRVKLMHEDYGDEGFWSGGVEPYGYRAVKAAIVDSHGKQRVVTRLEVDDDEAETILEATGRVLAGDSLAAVCRDFDERGVATRRGGPWHSATLKGILAGYSIAGRRVHRPRNAEGKPLGTRVVVAEWPAIVDEATHRRLLATLSNPSRDRRRNKSNRVAHLLAGLVVCGVCGGRVNFARGRDRRGNGKISKSNYICENGCVKVVAPYLEEQVVASLFGNLDRHRQAALRKQRGTSNVAELTAQLELVRERRQVAYLAHSAPEIGQRATTADEWFAARDRLDAQEREIEKLLTPAELAVELDAEGYDLQQRWEAGELDDDEQRRNLRRFVDRVVVNKATSSGGRGHDASRVDVQFIV